MNPNEVNWTNPNTNEKFIHRDRADGTSQFLYGPKDKPGEKCHGHAEFDQNRNLTFNRDPRDG